MNEPIKFTDIYLSDLNSISELQAFGFEGFVTIESLRNRVNLIPCEQGVYLLLRNRDLPPKFLSTGTGGYYQNKDPNVCMTRLKNEWVSDAIIVYVGKAGGKCIESDLNKRIKELLKFGKGKDVAHRGGRLVWQLYDAEQLLVCWKVLRDSEPRCVEKMLIETFKQSHGGKRPFANLID